MLYLKLIISFIIFLIFTAQLCTPANDIDNDGIEDDVDNCPYISNPMQEDSNNDGIGDGCETWNITYGGKDVDFGYSLSATYDGSYIITGLTESPDGIFGLYLLKIDQVGRKKWSQKYELGNGYDVKPLQEGGYIITGYTKDTDTGRSDLLLLKTDENGNEIWLKTFGGGIGDRGHALALTSDGGFIVVGYTQSNAENKFYDIWVIKTDNYGNKEWDIIWGGTRSEEAHAVVQTEDGGYIIAGFTESYGNGDFDGLLLKLDKEGKEKWYKTFGNAYSDKFYDMNITSDNGLILTGYSSSQEQGLWLIKTDLEGNVKWDKNFGYSSSDGGYSVIETTDKGFVVSGLTYNGNIATDFYIIKTDLLGNKEWEKIYGGHQMDFALGIIESPKGGYLVTGETKSYGEGGGDLWLIKTDEKGNAPLKPQNKKER